MSFMLFIDRIIISIEISMCNFYVVARETKVVDTRSIYDGQSIYLLIEGLD